MQDTQREFIRFAMQHRVLEFGSFVLKSGRRSPYFFNSGLFNRGASLLELGRHYARAILSAGIRFDVLYGAAYKGIPLVTAAATALASEHGLDTPWCFNRKEPKDHGEGGQTVGAELRGEVLLLDDVISAGTSLRESIALIEGAGARAAGLVVALDRQERGQGADSALREAASTYGLRARAIITLCDLIEFLEGEPGMEASLEGMRRYRREFGAAA